MNDGTTTGADETRIDPPDDGEEHPTDEEQTEREWHFWLGALLLVTAVLLVVVRPDLWPQIGVALVAMVVLGWLLKTVTERGE